MTTNELVEKTGYSIANILRYANMMPASIARKEKNRWLFEDEAIEFINGMRNRCPRKKVGKRKPDCLHYDRCLDIAAHDGANGEMYCQGCNRYEKKPDYYKQGLTPCYFYDRD